MKKCVICKIEKDENEFSPKCRQCRKCKNEKSSKYRKKWHQNNREHTRRVVHEHYLKNKDKVLERTKKWHSENKKKVKESWDKSSDKDKSKRRARKMIEYHLSKGNMIKPQACAKCSSEINIQAHHQDYNIPLQVIWLCSSCHAYEHRKFKL